MKQGGQGLSWSRGMTLLPNYSQAQACQQRKEQAVVTLCHLQHAIQRRWVLQLTCASF